MGVVVTETTGGIEIASPNSEPVHEQVHPKVSDFKPPPVYREVQISTLGKMLPAPTSIQLEVLHDAAFEIYKKQYLDAMIIHFLPQLHADIQTALRAQSKAGAKKLQPTSTLRQDLHDELSEYLIAHKHEFHARFVSDVPLAICDGTMEIPSTEALWASWNVTMRQTFTERWLGGPEGRLNSQKEPSDVLGFAETSSKNKI
jgi:hypothetical protein